MMDGSHRSEKKALIIGCGIAGPVLAMYLLRAGVTAVVYEGRAQPSDEAGAFLNLSPNGADVLATLGIKDAVLGFGTPTTSITFHNHRGKQLGENPERTTLIKRGLLNRGLREAALQRGVTIEYGKRLEHVEIAGDGTVIARFADGSQERGDCLVGCDGIHSRTRQSLMPDAALPTYTGVIDCGAFTRTSLIPQSDGVMRMTFGMKGFFGYQVVPSGEIYWFSNFTQPKEPDREQLESIPDEQWRDRLLEMHREDHYPITEVIRSTESRIGRWPIYDILSLPTWHRGPVCLIGDAAHATSPHAGQGAAMAMEDAIVLAKCLRDVATPQDAFATYEHVRKERVEKMVKQARRLGNQKVPTGNLGRWVRDLVLPFFLKKGVESTEWVYSYKVDWEEKVPSVTG